MGNLEHGGLLQNNKENVVYCLRAIWLAALPVLLRSMFIYVDATLSFIGIKCEIVPVKLAMISA